MLSEILFIGSLFCIQSLGILSAVSSDVSLKVDYFCICSHHTQGRIGDPNEKQAHRQAAIVVSTLMIFNHDGFWHYWWCRHQLETFSALLAICAGNSPVTGEFPSQRPVTRSFDVFCDLRLNNRLSKPIVRWWFETPSLPLWRQYNVLKRV